MPELKLKVLYTHPIPVKIPLNNGLRIFSVTSLAINSTDNIFAGTFTFSSQLNVPGDANIGIQLHSPSHASRVQIYGIMNRCLSLMQDSTINADSEQKNYFAKYLRRTSIAIL